ncbi:MAG: hypothetical protein AB7I48_27640 [Planctomycetaceae bacterium]
MDRNRPSERFASRSLLASHFVGPKTPPAPQRMTTSPSVDAGNRRLSLDVLRGYLLLNSFLMSALAPALPQLPPSGIRDVLTTLFTHAEWNGFHYVDDGFPAYMILIGVSMTLSFERRRHAGASTSQLFRKVVTRALLLWGLAFFVAGGFSVPFEKMNFTSIFVELSFCICATGIFLLTLSPRSQLLALIAFLLAHWGVLTIIAVPGYGYGDFSKEGNVESYFISAGGSALADAFGWTEPYDKFGKVIMWYLALPKILGTCLIGLLLGWFLQRNASSRRQAPLLAIMGAVAMAVAWAWEVWLPINKHLWTPSFTLFTGGFTFALMAIHMQISEVWNLRRVSFFFTTFGRTPLLAWLCFYLLPFHQFALSFFGPGFPPIFGAYRPLVASVTEVMLCWIFFAWLHRRHAPALIAQPSLTPVSNA